MRKYQKVEKTEPLTPSEHEKMSSELKRYGATRLTELSDDEKEAVENAVLDTRTDVW